MKYTISLAGVFATASLFLAACDTTGPRSADVGLVAPPLPAPATARTTEPPAFQRTTINERTTVGADGTVRTTRTTATVGFDPDRAATAAGALLAAANRPGDGSIAGTWTSRSSSTGTGCSVALYGDAAATSGQAASACNSSSVLGGVTAWRYAEGRLTLLKGDQVALQMNRAGPHRFDGTATWGFLSTTITLYR